MVKKFAIVYAAVMLSIIGFGCAMTPDAAEQLAGQANSANNSIGVISEEIAGLRADLEALNAEDPEAADAAAALIDLIDSKADEIERWQGVLDDATAKLAQAEDGWDLAEIIMGVGAGLFPPLAVGVPILQRSRRAFEGVIASVAAGGGPKDAQAVRDAMAHYPGLKERVTNTRVKLGDKVRVAVKPETD